MVRESSEATFCPLWVLLHLSLDRILLTVKEAKVLSREKWVRRDTLEDAAYACILEN